MMRSISVGLALAQEAERRTADRARAGMSRAVAMAAAGLLGFGALVFGSVGAMIFLGDRIGLDAAAVVVAAAWMVAAAIVVVIATRRDRRIDRRVLPPEAGERMLAALAEDLGRNSPMLALAALVLGVFTAAR